MALTRVFRKTIMDRASADPKFRRAMLTEAVNEFLVGDLQAGKAILRDYINATIGFEGLAKELRKSSKSIHRMLGPSGNPRAETFFDIIKALQSYEKIDFTVKVNRKAA